MTLFSAQAPRPLADRLRPRALAEVLGQEHILGPQGALTPLLAARRLPSLILWGPPGCGKTTIARLLAEAVDLEFVALSAVMSGVAELKAAFAEARRRRDSGQRPTLLFIDEIHRFNKTQQDGLLPAVEEGLVTLVGATTENPSFALVSALLSRARVLVLKRLDEPALRALLARAEAAVGHPLPLTDEARDTLLAMADGDGRALLNLCESLAVLPADAPLDPAGLMQAAQRRAPIYDKTGDQHYDLISVLHKAVRGSDPDAALYWLCRMLHAGEDPRYLARRIVRMANEDVGLAEPRAIGLALDAWETYERLGSPEGELALAQAVLYLAAAPKSNAVYLAYKAARAAAAEASPPPPRHAVNAPTQLMKSLGHGAGYAYDHDFPDAFAGRNFFPDEMPRRQFYDPTPRGLEGAIADRLRKLAERRER